MVGYKTAFGLLATLAVVGVALPGTAQWSNPGGDSNGVTAGEYGNSGAGGQSGGQDGSNGYAGGAGAGFGTGAGAQDQSHSGNMGAEGADGQVGGHGGSHTGGNGEQGHGGGGSDGSRGGNGGSGKSPGGAWRRHENSGEHGSMAGSVGANQNGNHDNSGSGKDGEHSWDKGSSEGRPADHEGHEYGDGSGKGGKDADRPGGVRPRDEEVDAVKELTGKQKRPRDEGDAIKDTLKAVIDTSKQRHARDEEDAVKEALKDLTDTSKQRHAHSSEEEQDGNENADDDNQSDIDLNEFSRRWQEALDDEDAPDIRFKFDSDHPNAVVTTLKRRAAGLGFYECARRMYTAPCHFTDFVQGECYER